MLNCGKNRSNNVHRFRDRHDRETDISPRTLPISDVSPDVFPLLFCIPGHFPFRYVWRAGAWLSSPSLMPSTACRYCTTGLQTWRRQATDTASDLLQRLTTAAAAPLFRASRCVRCRRCSRYPPGTCMSPRWTGPPDEAWNRGFAALVGRNHPSVWCAIESLQQEAAAASTTLLQNARGQPPLSLIHIWRCRRRG